MEDYIKNLVDGNLEVFREKVYNSLYMKSGEFLNQAKKDISASLYSDQVEESDDETIKEALTKNQSEKLDVSPRDGKLTGSDFKALRAKKKR